MMGNQVYVSETGETRADILKRLSPYDTEKRNRPYKAICILHGKTPKILEKYNYSQYIKDINESEDTLVFKVLDFVCD